MSLKIKVVLYLFIMDKEDRKENIANPLLPASEEHDPEKTMENRVAVKIVLRAAALPCLAGFFWPVETLTNTIYLGHQPDSVNMLAGFGLGTLSLNFVMLAFSNAFSEAGGTFMAQSNGQEDYNMCAIYRNRQVVINLCLFVVLSVPLYFARPIFTAMG